MTKALPYLVLGALVVGLISLYLLWENRTASKEQTDILKDQSKVQSDQTTLLVAMAQKLTGENPLVPEVTPAQVTPASTASAPAAEAKKLSQEEQDKIITISDKICFGKPLNADENVFTALFPDHIKRESEISKKTLATLVGKFLTDTKDFTKYEKDFYQDNQADIDTIVHDKKAAAKNEKLFASVISKLTSGNNDFSAEELEYQQNYPKAIEEELARLKAETEKMKGAGIPNAADERLKIILSFFKDGIPKTVTKLAELYAAATDTKPNKSNASIWFGKLVEDGKIACQQARKGQPVYHGLPQWFEEGKLKPEYQQKLQKEKA